MVTSVEIDLNVRVRGTETYVGIEDVNGYAKIGDFVQVFESESTLVGLGRITEVDAAKRLVYLAVDWANLREDAAAVSEILRPRRPFQLSDEHGVASNATAAASAALIDNRVPRELVPCR